MRNKMVVVAGVFLSLIFLSGCASVGRRQNLENQGLKNQVQALEAQLQEKDREVISLREALSRETEEKAALRRGEIIMPIPEAKSHFSTKDIQEALKNSGYDPGPIDGKKGKKTREAIRAFQKANGLKVDGKVGKQTWELLRQYLSQEKKVK